MAPFNVGGSNCVDVHNAIIKKHWTRPPSQ